jgi:NAD(P)-dependent dehydrogenase (short-subunit alcohol dehydrogenase family)
VIPPPEHDEQMVAIITGASQGIGGRSRKGIPLATGRRQHIAALCENAQPG